MAHMIPKTPKEFDKRSNEGTIFEILKNGLSDDYYVFHSVNEVQKFSNNYFLEREIDFVIANRKKGILCIEVKSGSGIYYKDRTWFYTNGTPMSHDGPYKQIASAKRTLKNKIEFHNDFRVRNLLKSCKILHAVMFFDISRDSFDYLDGLPEEADINITVLADDLINIQTKIENIFELQITNSEDIQNLNMDEAEFNLLLNSVLCPHFKLIPSPKASYYNMEESMNQLLREQYLILDFLDEQDNAVINGPAGSGKTMLAVEKARRHSINNESVLFLCYNRMLCDYLNNNYRNNLNKELRSDFEKVSFMTISKLAYDVLGNYEDFEGLLNWLLDCADKKNKFPFKHIIIDEGQDFGVFEKNSDSQDDVDIIDALQVIAKTNDGTFYLFYDKYQMIQGSTKIINKLPYCIENADTRLSLKKNCRNTYEIAKTSTTPLKDYKNNQVKFTTSCNWEKGYKPRLNLIENFSDYKSCIDQTLDELIEEGYQDIIILTTKTTEYCCLSDFIDEGEGGFNIYKRKSKNIKFTTCKKFKGLEADCIILVDLDKYSFIDKNALTFYVGSSRAKHRLEFICLLKDDEYYDFIKQIDKNAPNKKDSTRMRKIIGSTFSSEIIKRF